METFDDLQSLKEELAGYHAFICTLGTRTKVGEAEFTKVDLTYPLEFAKLGRELGVPHYLLLTSMGANFKSLFLYMRVKGQVEEAIKQLRFPKLSIYRPGLLLNREHDHRIGEKIASYIPFISKIEAADVGRVMLEHAVGDSPLAPTENTSQVNVIVHDQIRNEARALKQ